MRGKIIIQKYTSLIPYLKNHIEKYHMWMQNLELQQNTESEPLTFEQEISMHREWDQDPQKLTFIITPTKYDNYTTNGVFVEEDIYSTFCHKCIYTSWCNSLLNEFNLNRLFSHILNKDTDTDKYCICKNIAQNVINSKCIIGDVNLHTSSHVAESEPNTAEIEVCIILCVYLYKYIDIHIYTIY